MIERLQARRGSSHSLSPDVHAILRDNGGDAAYRLEETQELAMTPVADDIIPAGKPWSAIIRRRQRLRIIDIEGNQGVDFLCYSAANPEERYHAANTLKKSSTLLLTTGHTLYSDMARPLMTIVADTCGVHDTIGGCCSAPSNEMLYGVRNAPGCRENFLSELAKHGLGRRDIVANLNFFCNVPVHDGNRLEPLTFAQSPSKAGNYIELRAEMDVLAVISNCPQVNNPCNSGQPTPIRALVFAAEDTAH